MVILVVCAVTCLCMIAGVLFLPKIRLGKVSLDTYWVVVLIGAVAVLLCKQTNVIEIAHAMVANTAVNPVKILTLFLSMTVLSIFLDELGFFRYLAGYALRQSHGGQKRLFFSLYITVAILTVFTSNDVIVLSFTPFICYFAKEAKIDPMPYLACEFVAANTWSTTLVIGNPTNIYLATACGLDFLKYLKISILPTVATGLVSLLMLWLIFRKKLSTPICGTAERSKIDDHVSLIIGILHLAVCTVLLAISSYIGVESWLIALCSVGSLFVCNGILLIVRKQRPHALVGCLKRAPWTLVPFLLSMFVMTEALAQQGITATIANYLGTNHAIWKYGALSFLTSNLINNIPMSVLFSSMIGISDAGMGALFATIIGSNLGAVFTPIGALAGLMFSSILAEHDIKFGYRSFLKLGALVAIPALAAALGVLELVLLII